MLPTSHLIEALTIGASQVVPIPDASDSVMGVFNWRGEVLWLIDLGHLLGDARIFSGSSQPGNLSVIVMRINESTLGLVVDHVTEMLWCDSSNISPPESTSPACEFMQGIWKAPQSGDAFLILDCLAIQDHFA